MGDPINQVVIGASMGALANYAGLYYFVTTDNLLIPVGLAAATYAAMRSNYKVRNMLPGTDWLTRNVSGFIQPEMVASGLATAAGLFYNGMSAQQCLIGGAIGAASLFIGSYLTLGVELAV